MDNGITLTTNGRSWVSVANPLRHDTIAGLAQAQAKYDTSQVSARSGAVGVIVGAAVGLIAVLVGLPALLAVVCGLVALPVAWLLTFRRLRSRAAAFESTLAANAEGLGPRRIVRGEFLPGACADAADQLVIGTVQILQSTAYRCGALGETSFVYDEILDATWSLLHKLRTYEREVRDMARMEERACDERTRRDLATLADRMNHVWSEQLLPLVDAHRDLVRSVADLDRFLDTPHARDHGKQLAAADDSPRTAADDLDALTGRVAAARDRALAYRSGYPDADTTSP